MLVKIKTWEQMEKEYGLDEDENIMLSDNRLFSITTESLLPKSRIIVIVESSGDYIWFTSYGLWGVPEEAIEKILTPEEHPQYFI